MSDNNSTRNDGDNDTGEDDSSRNARAVNNSSSIPPSSFSHCSSTRLPELKFRKSMDLEFHCADFFGYDSDSDNFYESNDHKDHNDYNATKRCNGNGNDTNLNVVNMNKNNKNKNKKNNDELLRSTASTTGHTLNHQRNYIHKNETIDDDNNVDDSYRQKENFGRYNSHGYDFDSDEDSFAEADSDCEPNQYYLDEMLEEIHPERINLFEYKKKGSEEHDRDNEYRYDRDDQHDNENDYNSCLSDGDDDDDNGGESILGRLGVEDDSIINSRITKDGESSSDDAFEGDTFDCCSNDSSSNTSTATTTTEDRNTRRRTKMNFGNSVSASAPGRPLLRQPSRKAVWGK